MKPSSLPGLTFAVFALGCFGLPSLARAEGSSVALHRETLLPVQTTHLGDRWFFDFGREAYGQFEVEAPGALAGRALTVRLGEVLAAPGRLDPAPGGSRRFHEVPLTLAAGTNFPILRAADARRMPAAIGAVMPYRYAEVLGWPENAGAPVVRQLAVFGPFAGPAGEFDCDRPELNEIWQLCRYTMKATSFCGLFVDGDRERLPYEADAWINQLGWYATTADVTVPRATLDFLLQNPTWPTEWQAHTLFLAWGDYLQTGDSSRLEKNYEHLRALTLSALERPDGLISTTDPATLAPVLRRLGLTRMNDNVDWPKGERDNFDFRPVNTVINAFHYAALDRFSQIAAALGRREEAARTRRQAEFVRAAINRDLFDSASGLYRDGLTSGHSSVHANLFPLALGVVPPARVPAVGRYLASRGMACSPYAAQYLLEALYAAQQDEAALQLMLNRTDRGWLHMIRDAGATITFEAWDDRYKPNEDHNHAWGAAPANIIPRFIAGCQPLAPRWERWRLAPHPGSLGRYSSRIPTPHGLIESAFQRHSGGWTLDLTVPNGTTAWLQPGGREGWSLVEVRSASGNLPIRDPAHLELPAGRYRLKGR